MPFFRRIKSRYNSRFKTYICKRFFKNYFQVLNKPVLRLYLKLVNESIAMAVGALVVNKLRTVLSLLGITIGILAIISVFTMVDSMEKQVRGSVESLGDDVIFIQKWPWTFGQGYPWWKYWQRPVPTLKELHEVQERSKNAEALAFMAHMQKTVEYGSSNLENVSIVCVSHDWQKIKTFELMEGRYFTPFESAGGRNVAIIGSQVAEGLFGEANPIGKTIKTMGRKIDVIGVFDKEGESLFGNSTDNQVVIPAVYARSLVDLRKERFNPMIQVKGREGVSNEELKDELRGIMRSVRKQKPLADDNFALNETSLLSNSMEGLFAVINGAGWLIGLFSILVGGFGIANIMFVSVKERTHIIGIQKSLGAKNYFILLQFLFEAIFLCIIGGSAGLLIVFFLSLAGSNILDLDISLSLKNVFLGLGISAGIGLVSGIVPAWIASRLDPVEAIRSNG